ncbi:Protein roadkill [Aphelenchoides besseyi]|nr:Protein roadkill [Aphelenchoides besseyi]
MRRLAPGTPIGSMATNRGGEMASTSNDSTVAIWCIDDYIKRYQQASVGDWWISEVFAFDHPQFGIIKFFLRFMPKNGCEASDAFIDMQVMNPPVKSSISIKCKAWIETYDKRRYETLGVNRPVPIRRESFGVRFYRHEKKSKLIRSQTIFVCLRSQYPVKTVGTISYPNALHCWPIPDLAPQFADIKTGTPWESEEFTIPQLEAVKFAIVFYPRGDGGKHQNYCALELKVNTFGAHSKLTIQFELWLGNPDRRLRKISFNHVFLNGLPDGISHYETLSRFEEFIVEGPFNIYCNICPITAVVAPTREPIFDQRFASFFNNPFFSDAEIHVDNKIFKISRAIVSGSSPIFRAMFDKKIKRTNERSVAMVEKMLIYIYENKVDNLNDIAAELLPVADYYQIDNLVKICVDSIVNNLTTKNVLSVLQLAFDRPHLIEFRVHVMNFTNANYNEIRQLDGFEEFFDAQPEIANQ